MALTKINGSLYFKKGKIIMNLFDLPEKEFEEELNKLFKSQTKEQLLCDLVKCGLELSKEDKIKWIDPIYIDTKEEAEMLVNALERATAAPHKNIDVDYKEVTDAIEIRKMFGVDNNEKDN